MTTWNEGAMDATPIYTVTTYERGKVLQALDVNDPFIHTTFRLKPGLRSRLEAAWAALSGRFEYAVTVGARSDVVERVCELDPDYLGAIGSERRQRWDQHFQRGLGDFAARIAEHDTDSSPSSGAK